MKSGLIQDVATRQAVQAVEKNIERINRIPQLSKSASLEEVIDAINKITASMKR